MSGESSTEEGSGWRQGQIGRVMQRSGEESVWLLEWTERKTATHLIHLVHHLEQRHHC